MAGSGTYIANLNAETQIVIAGTDEAMAGVAKRALEKGASKAHRLAVSVPSHCELLAEPAQKLAEAFSLVTLSRLATLISAAALDACCGSRSALLTIWR